MNAGITTKGLQNNAMKIWGICVAVFRNKTVSILFRIVLTALFFLLVNRSISSSVISKLVINVKMPYVAGALVLCGAGIYFQVVRWKIVLKSVGLPYEKNVPLKTMLWGNFLGFMTPGRVGELLRGTGIDPKRKADSVLSVLIDRLIAVMMVLLTGIVFIGIQLMVYRQSLHIIQIIALSIIGAVCCLLVVYKNVKFPFVAKLFDKVPLLIQGIKNVTDFRVILISVLAHMCLLLQTALMLNMFGMHKMLDTIAVGALAYMQMIFLPFSIANVGIREYSFGVYIAKFSPDSDASGIAFGVSSFILFFNIILPALGGLIWFMLDIRKKSRL